MITIRHTGPTLADVASDLRGVRTRVLPYAAAAALTKAAQRGQSAVIGAMPRVFRNPVRYTLNATRIEPASIGRLFARIAVKDQRPGGGTRPQSYLLPEVQGGTRGAKGFEIALRAAGVLGANEFAMPAGGVQRDAAGNVSGATVRGILRQLGRGAKSAVFAGVAGRSGARGIWQREGDGLKPLFIFTTDTPDYRAALDFSGVAQASVDRFFASDFYDYAKRFHTRFGT